MTSGIWIRLLLICQEFKFLCERAKEAKGFIEQASLSPALLRFGEKRAFERGKNMGDNNNPQGISGFTLKMIAVISMFIDHLGATVLERILFGGSLGASAAIYVNAHWEALYQLYMVMRGIGRLAFPIYCFLIVEGFWHTRSVPKYAARLFVFALISEIPFDLAIRGKVWDLSYNNVFFTLFIGLVVIAGLRWCNEKICCIDENGNVRLGNLFLHGILSMCMIFAGMAAAEILFKCDYGAAGIITIVVIYLLRRHPKTAILAAVILLAVLSSELEIVALADVFVIAYYNGTRGKQSKYFFYAFYPVHLLLLAGICMLLGLGI